MDNILIWYSVFGRIYFGNTEFAKVFFPIKNSHSRNGRTAARRRIVPFAFELWLVQAGIIFCKIKITWMQEPNKNLITHSEIDIIMCSKCVKVSTVSNAYSSVLFVFRSFFIDALAQTRRHLVFSLFCLAFNEQWTYQPK